MTSHGGPSCSDGYGLQRHDAWVPPVSLVLTVHRGTRQIGGSCIEIAHPEGDRIVLDAGRPLDAPDGAPRIASCVA